MDKQMLDEQRAYWDRAFAGERLSPIPQWQWIEELAGRASIELAGSVLEIGCGRGHDTRYLLEAGCHVTCLDLSWNALRHVGRIADSVQRVNAALPAPLPFRAEAFDLVVAGLSLHYFPWRETCGIAQEIARVLRPGGALIFRVNSTDDVAHGYGRGEEVEPHAFVDQGHYKRFFDEAMCRRLFGAAWRIELLLPWTETRFDAPKPTWMGVVCLR